MLLMMVTITANHNLAQRRRGAEITTMDINQIAKVIVDRAVNIHMKLGPGLLESVYHRILAYELRKAGLKVATEVPIPVEWDDHIIDESFRADMIINDLVLIELKSVEQSTVVHGKQTLTYIKLAKLELGLLLNFGSNLLKDDLHRLVNNLKD